jgi:hypothetical protein
VKLIFIILFCSAVFAEATTTRNFRDEILKVADKSECGNIFWIDRGFAPRGFIKGMALTYARSVCRLQYNTAIGRALSRKNSHVPETDVFAYLQKMFEDTPIYDLETDGFGPLQAVYGIGLGVGMRESSGNYCEGADILDSETAEYTSSGLFQETHSLLEVSPLMRDLYAEYVASPERCLRDVFEEGAQCVPKAIVGEGAPAEFQKFAKSCPAFAAELGMLSLRLVRKFYGPVGRKEAELHQSCVMMFGSVEELVFDGDVEACKQLLSAGKRSVF